MISSERPSAYTSALSTSVPPAATKLSSWLNAPASSVSLPNVSVPRASADTAHPLLPSSRYSMTPPSRVRMLRRLLPHLSGHYTPGLRQ